MRQGPGSEREAEKRAGFLGFVAHEVRNPLATALWSAELLVRLPATERAGARGEKLSAMCLRSLGRVRQLVEDHLLCERLDAGGIPLRPEPFQARAAVQALLDGRAHGAARAELEIDPDLTIECDRPLLERALESLVAVAGADGTAVRLAARTEESRIALVVSGASARAEGLQDPVKGSESDVHGRALALPLARRIAAALGGALEADAAGWVLTVPREPMASDPPGAGSP